LREVQSPDGRVWRIRRRWLPKPPWLPREDAVDRGRPDWWWRGGIVWLLFDRIIYPALMLAMDILWFAVSLPFSIAARLLGLSAWRIEAATIGRPRMRREVEAKGRLACREAIDELATEIGAGR
jgi:hypothetical protein